MKVHVQRGHEDQDQVLGDLFQDEQMSEKGCQWKSWLEHALMMKLVL